MTWVRTTFSNVADPVALGQILLAATVDQANAADIDRLLADGDFAAAHIDIGVAQRADQLRHRDAVGLELLQVRLDLEFLGCAAPDVDGDDAGNGNRRRVTTQSCTVRRLVRPKCGGPTTW